MQLGAKWLPGSTRQFATNLVDGFGGVTHTARPRQLLHADFRKSEIRHDGSHAFDVWPVSRSLVDSPGTLRPMLWLTAPVLVEQMLHLLVQYVDFFLTGRILQSDTYLAAMTLMIYAAWFIANLFSLVGIGATALVARMVGGGDREGANRVMHQALATGGLWAALLMAVGFPLVDQILRRDAAFWTRPPMQPHSTSGTNWPSCRPSWSKL